MKRRHRSFDGAALGELGRRGSYWIIGGTYGQHLVLASMALLCFGASFDGEFVFDDSEAIVNNGDVRGTNGLRQLLINDFWGNPIRSLDSHKSYRPLTVLTYRANHAVSGLDTKGYHLVNLLLHTVTTLLVHRCGRMVMEHLDPEDSLPSSFPFLSALLFAVHPIHTESVANIVGRAELLMTVFALIAFLNYHAAMKECTEQRWKQLASVAALSLASMLCKEQGITIMGICFIYDCLANRPSVSEVRHQLLLYLGDRTNNNLESRQDCLLTKKYKPLVIRLSFLACSASAFLFLRFWIMGFQSPKFSPMDNPASFEESVIIRAINYQYLYLLNIWLMVNPSELCFDYSMGCIPLIRTWTDLRLAAVGLFLIMIISISVALYLSSSNSKRVLLFGFALLVVPFLPASNLFFRVGFVLAERVLYLPSIGFCYLLAIALSSVVQSSESPTSRLNRYIKPLIGALILLWTIKSIQRSTEWRSEKELYRSGAAVCPQNAKIHYNLGKVLTDGGLQSDAVEKYREALRLNPAYDHAMNNLANLLEQKGEYAEAERLLLRAVELRPNFAAAWMNLGIVQTALGRWFDAETAYSTALRLRSPYPDCLFNLGNLYLAQNRLHEAIASWRNATRLEPRHAKAWINQMILLDNEEDCEAAIDVGREALLHIEHDAGVHFSLGSCLGKLGRFEEAERSLLAAIRFDPLNAPYYGNLGVLYHRWRKFDRAEASYRRALQLDSGLVGIQKHLEQLIATKANDLAKAK